MCSMVSIAASGTPCQMSVSITPAATALHVMLHQAVHVRRLANISLDETHRTAESLDRIGDLVGGLGVGVVVDEDVGTFGGQSKCDRPPDTSRRASDQGCLAFESLRHLPKLPAPRQRQDRRVPR